ncbi:hypothetical protein BSZ39_03185 [Bowdeniella nasicola]|uniref:Protein-glutamine gamma-glutamyltransferase-like C-terminal domain-containing protein n=1 Tax=Bowdeniella nasicola TaxID=208480 RepID=A0A1Q5Q489_9ACTO|nr:DUF4129 domain-containing protein [Bowdeniella nasicola]OKL54616.1 hypothetical protein BSZ39_03185 [Bowdeniella nasicola]
MRNRSLAAILALACCLVVFIGSLPPAIRLRPQVTTAEHSRDYRPGPGYGPHSGEEVFPPAAPDLSDLLAAAGAVFFVVIVLGAIFGVGLWLHRSAKRRGSAEQVDDGARFDALITAEEPIYAHQVARARSALADLDVSPTDRVIATWVELERAASAKIGARSASVTPAEWARERLVRSGADEAATQQLIDLYHRARFRPNTTSTNDDIAAAHAALETIEASLAEAPKAGSRR